MAEARTPTPAEFCEELRGRARVAREEGNMTSTCDAIYFETSAAQISRDQETIAALMEAFNKAASEIEHRALEIDLTECCGDGIQVAYDEPPECCANPDYLISSREAAAIVRVALRQAGER